MSAAPDLDRFMLDYRECARHVWNAYFRLVEDGWHEFINVEFALFEGLVLGRAGLRGNDVRSADGLVLGIRVIPLIPPIGHLDVFHVATPTPASGTAQWKEGALGPGTADLRFCGFFDWANDNDPKDFRFVRVRVLSSEQPEFSGNDLLIAYEHSRFVLAP